MIFKNFRIQILLRVLAICALVYLFIFLLMNARLPATTAVCGLLAVFLIYDLIRYAEKTNRNLTRFLQAIRHADFSQSFSGGGLGASFEELNREFAAVIGDFQRIRSEKEEQYLYLQTVVQHVGIGLLAFDSLGEVELMNSAAKRLLKVNQMKNITSLGLVSQDLVEALFSLKAGERKLVKIYDQDDVLQLIIYATEIKLQARAIRLVSLQNIQSELEEQEMEAWQKLIRVLTHEIMNSITPISSLAATTSEMLQECEPPEPGMPVEKEIIGDVRSAVQTIRKRSEGLLHFVKAYRSLTRLPKPDFRIFPVRELFSRLQQLYLVPLKDKGVTLKISVEPSNLELTADPDMIEQILINMIKNSSEALEGRKSGRIFLGARLDVRGRVVLQVWDNGPGITPEAREKIFIPFFTTKPNGSGIGLSLARQVMRLHRGSISLHSVPDEETVFTLRF